MHDPTLSTDRIHRQGSGWLGSRLKPGDQPAARVGGNVIRYVEAVAKREGRSRRPDDRLAPSGMVFKRGGGEATG
jgi:hypothetical protein